VFGLRAIIPLIEKLRPPNGFHFFLVSGLLPKYLCYYMSMDAFRDYLTSQASGVGGSLMRIKAATFAGYAFPLPPLPEQHRIVAEVERRLSVIDELEATIDVDLKRAERLRQSILKRAFEGNLVLQDPNDEPASVLLERIRAERAVGATGRSPLRAGGKKRNSRESDAQAELFS
jgi:type I restriction enzyme S subunit